MKTVKLDLPIVGIKLYYADDSIEKISDLSKWNDLPKDNLQIIVTYHDKVINGRRYKTLIQGFEYYNYDFGEKTFEIAYSPDDNRYTKDDLEDVPARAIRGTFMLFKDFEKIYVKAFMDNKF